MQKIFLFLASSEELKADKEKIEIFINRENDDLIEKGLFIKLILCEDFNEAVSATSKQDEYNEAIRESDILLILVFSKVGKYLEQEFDTGHKRFIETGSPKIFTYFKTPRTYDRRSKKEDAVSVFDFEEKLGKLGHFTSEFKDIESLLLQFGKQLNDIVGDKSKRPKASGLPHLLTNIPKHNEEFIGREEDLINLDKLLQQSKKVVLMNGMGGIGKTTLAKKYVQDHLDKYDHIAWVEVKSQDSGGGQDMTVVEAFAYEQVLTKNLGLDFTNESNEIRFEILCNALSNIPGKNLLIIDNGRDDLGARDIKNVLPQPPSWRVLVTSRQEFSGFEKLSVDKLSESEAIKLFREHYTKNVTDEEVKELLEEVGYHTLTIELLAKTLNYPGQTLSVKETIAKLRDRKINSPVLQRLIESPHSEEETEIYIHLTQTFNMLPLSEYDKWLMKQFIFLLPQQYKVSDIEIVLSSSDEAQQKELQNGLNSLAKRGWLKYTEETYGMHRMVQQMVYYQLEPTLKDITSFIERFSELLSFDASTDFTQLFPLIPYTEFILSQIKKDESGDAKISVLQHRLGVIYGHLGEYEKGRALLEAALESDIKNFGEKNHIISIRRSDLAVVYRHLGKYEKARDLQEVALLNDLSNFDEDHPNVATSRCNLAIIYRNLGEYEKARDLLEKALASDLKNLGEDSPDIAISRSNLANVYSDMGDHEKARELLEQALASDLKNFNEAHPKIAIRRSNLALVYSELGDREKARDLLIEALASDLKNFGENHPAVGVRINNLALVYLHMGEFKEAIDHFEKAIAILTKTVGTDHPHTKMSIMALEFAKKRMNE